MNVNFNIFLDYEDDTLNIIKTPSKTPVKTLSGKYGIELKQDIDGKTVEIIIPEPDILFGVNIEDIESFLIVNIL